MRKGAQTLEDCHSIDIVTRVLPNRDSEIKGAIMRIAKINTIVKCPVNKLFAVENTYYGNNKTDRQVITNNKLPLRLTLIKCHISTLSQLRKFNCVTFIAERLIFAVPSTPFDIPDTKKRKLRCKSA